MKTTIKVYRTNTGYIADLNGACFEMSDNADQPNGVNMYMGIRGQDLPNSIVSKYPKVQLSQAPNGVQSAIKQRMEAL